MASQGRQAVAAGYQSRTRSRSLLRDEDSSSPQPPQLSLPPVPVPAPSNSSSERKREHPPGLILTGSNVHGGSPEQNGFTGPRSPRAVRQLTDPPLSPGGSAMLSPQSAKFPRNPSPLSPNAASRRGPPSSIIAPPRNQAVGDALVSPALSESRYPVHPSPIYAGKSLMHSPSMETLVGSARGHDGMGLKKEIDGFQQNGGIPILYSSSSSRTPTTRWSLDSTDEKGSKKSGSTKASTKSTGSAWLQEQQRRNSILKKLVWSFTILALLGAGAAVFVHFYKPPVQTVHSATPSSAVQASTTIEAADPSNTGTFSSGMGGGYTPEDEDGNGSKRKRGLHIVKKHARKL